VLRDATPEDVAAIAGMAADRRAAYEQAQPQFWRRAARAVEVHTPWLSRLVADPEVIALVAVDDDGTVVGYVMATIVATPPVYDPGGPTGVIDDVGVADPELWPTCGRALLDAARDRLRAVGACQLVVVCGHHDQAQRDVLLGAGMSLASEWYVAPIAPVD
jgi:L-amino acid N-acyltransferase YncA